MRLVQEAGLTLLRHRANGLEIHHKARGELVTGADLASHRLIRDGLARAFPVDALDTEEAADTPDRLTARRVWIVDPLDSTSACAAGSDEYSVSIGLAVGAQPVLGAVYNPAGDELIAGGDRVLAASARKPPARECRRGVRPGSLTRKPPAPRAL